jgi:hypothetical protein
LDFERLEFVFASAYLAADFGAELAQLAKGLYANPGVSTEEIL